MPRPRDRQSATGLLPRPERKPHTEAEVQALLDAGQKLATMRYSDAEFEQYVRLYFHVQSHGGGDDMDEDGNECGHDGAAISGMEIEQPAFFYNGRRAGTVIKYGPAKGRT